MIVTVGGMLLTGVGVGAVISTIAENAAEKRGDIERADSIAFWTKLALTTVGYGAIYFLIKYSWALFL